MAAEVSSMRPYVGELAGVRDIATGIKLFQVVLHEPEGQAAFCGLSTGAVRLRFSVWSR